MTPFTESVIENCLFVGEWIITDKIKFNTSFSRKELIDLGDLIYFVIWNEMTIKVGLTVDMYMRQNAYQNNMSCRTTQRVLTKSKEYNIDNVKIYVQQIPRINASLKSFFSGIRYNESISQLKKYEHIYVHEAEKAGETLIFNNQKTSK